MLEQFSYAHCSMTLCRIVKTYHEIKNPELTTTRCVRFVERIIVCNINAGTLIIIIAMLIDAQAF